ncbi:hypothetical protein [Corynebacterium sp.]|uniref:hypothetical protein n=1 Tax=Corynebacterium sp. TaxID=1720 RepID=UPI0028B127C2|nr:hypothetical protein [Corynebacterium sp.]
MGINPTRGLLPNLAPETPQERYGDIFDMSKEDGEVLSEELGGIKVTADSANSGTGELAQDLTDLETRVATAENLLRHAVIAVPPASLDDLPSGQVYLDQATGTISQKP